MAAERDEDFLQIAASVPNSIEKIAEAIPMCVLKHETGITKIERLIDQEISRCVAMMNVGGNLKGFQIEFTVETIMTTYPAESVEDIILCLRRGSTGYYGTTYNHLDTGVIIGWLKLHLEEKAYFLERNNAKSKEELPQYLPNYEEFKKNLERRRAEEVRKKSVEREIKIKQIEERSEPTRKAHTVVIEFEDDKGNVVSTKTYENVFAPNMEVATKTIVDLIKSGQI